VVVRQFASGAGNQGTLRATTHSRLLRRGTKAWPWQGRTVPFDRFSFTLLILCQFFLGSISVFLTFWRETHVLIFLEGILEFSDGPFVSSPDASAFCAIEACYFYFLAGQNSSLSIIKPLR
jgi:hypothetical protein